MANKELSSSWEPAEGINTEGINSSLELGKLSLCWGEFRTPVKPAVHSLLFMNAQKTQKKICFLPLVATASFHQGFLQKPKGKRFSWIQERDLGNCSIPEFTHSFSTPNDNNKSPLFRFVGSFFQKSLEAFQLQSRFLKENGSKKHFSQTELLYKELFFLVKHHFLKHQHTSFPHSHFAPF